MCEKNVPAGPIYCLARSSFLETTEDIWKRANMPATSQLPLRWSKNEWTSALKLSSISKKSYLGDSLFDDSKISYFKVMQ